MKAIIQYESPVIYYRLIALWVLCEAMLGGIIHGLKLPVSGLLVGSAAVVCICLIAWYVPVKHSIIKATLIVAIFKMMLSPQAPLPAYFAVFFQGLCGELLFSRRRFFKVACVLLGVLSLVESGLQRILVLTIIYGNDLWTVLNEFIGSLLKRKTSTNYSLIVGSVYVLVHFITGLIVGLWVAGLPDKIKRWGKDDRFLVPKPGEGTALAVPMKNRKRKRWILFVVWIFLVAVYVQSYFNTANPILPAHVSLKILLRSVIIVITWIIIIGPLLTRLLHHWLKSKQTQSAKEITELLHVLPGMQHLVSQCWMSTRGMRSWKRMRVFAKTLLINCFYTVEPVKDKHSVYILTAATGSGKTSSVIKWAAGRKDVYGVLTPVIKGRRVFLDAHTNEQFDMEAAEGEFPTLQIGRFQFSKKAFEKATNILRGAIDKPGWLVIDEIGPLEINGEGFHDIAKQVLAKRDDNILLVVRDKDEMVNRVKEKFQVKNPILIRNFSGFFMAK